MIKNKIKRISKKKILLFVCSFLGILACIVFPTKFFGFRGDIYTWEDIVHALPIYIIGSLLFAAWMTWVAFGE
jgi:O-antigen/teichoic acid export membrane protein